MTNQITFNDLKTEISQVLQSDAINANLHFITDNTQSVSRADLDQELQKKICEAYKKEVLEYFGHLKKETKLLNISTADERKNAIYVYDLAEDTDEIKASKKVHTESIDNLFSFESYDLSNVEGVVVKIGSSDEHLTLYRFNYPVSIVKRESQNSISISRKGITIRGESKNTRIAEITDNLLRLNFHFDFLFYKDKTYICNLSVLEKQQKFHVLIHTAAKIELEKIKSFNLLEDQSCLDKEVESNVSFARKLLKVSEGSLLLKKGVKNDVIINFIENREFLNKKIKLNDDKSKLILRSKKSKDMFLKLLDDDYLRSELSDEDYEILAKDNIKTE